MEALTIQQARQLVNPLEERLRELVLDKFGIIPKEELYGALGLGGPRTSVRKIGHDQMIESVMEEEGWTSKRRRKPNKMGSHRDNRENVFLREYLKEASPFRSGAPRC